MNWSSKRQTYKGQKKVKNTKTWWGKDVKNPQKNALLHKCCKLGEAHFGIWWLLFGSLKMNKIVGFRTPYYNPNNYNNDIWT